MMFNKLTEPERETIERVLTRDYADSLIRQFKKSCQTAYVFRGNFTIALVLSSKKLYVGAAKRNPGDRDNTVVAQNVALSRAVRSAPVEVK